jgi:hypothetical protein
MRAFQTLNEKSINQKLENSIFKYKFLLLGELQVAGFFGMKQHYVRQIFRYALL